MKQIELPMSERVYNPERISLNLANAAGLEPVSKNHLDFQNCEYNIDSLNEINFVIFLLFARNQRWKIQVYRYLCSDDTFGQVVR